MSLLASPLLIINLGCEMVFVIHQRLHAQNVAPVKRCRVLHDIVNGLLDDAFLKELLTPQRLTSFDAAKDLFQKLVHVSIMRLNDASMSKLFDLMVMVCKYHVLHCHDASQLLRVTSKHLDEIAPLVEEADRVNVMRLKTRLQESYSQLSKDQWRALWSTLMGNLSSQLTKACVSRTGFYQGKRTKVSVLLQLGVQQQNGKIVIPELPTTMDERVGCGHIHDRMNIVVSDDKIVDLDEEAVHSSLSSLPELGTNLYMRRYKEGETANDSGNVPPLSSPLDREARELRFLSSLMRFDSRSRVEDADFDLLLEDDRETAIMSIADQKHATYVHDLTRVTDGFIEENKDAIHHGRHFEDDLLGFLDDPSFQESDKRT